MTVLPALVLMAALGQTPVDRAELAKAQSSLESYFSRIKTLQLTYTQKWTPPAKPIEVQDPPGRARPGSSF